MSDALHSEEWKRIAEKITKETDHRRITELVQELCDAFDRRKQPNKSKEIAQPELLSG